VQPGCTIESLSIAPRHPDQFRCFAPPYFAQLCFRDARQALVNCHLVICFPSGVGKTLGKRTRRKNRAVPGASVAWRALRTSTPKVHKPSVSLMFATLFPAQDLIDLAQHPKRRVTVEFWCSANRLSIHKLVKPVKIVRSWFSGEGRPH
jgi:hypothetical protein